MSKTINLARKIATTIVVALAFARAFAQDASSPAHLVWQDVAPIYERFDEIKPTLVNHGQKSVFLSRLYPNGSAQLQRRNEATGDWESGAWGNTCDPVSHATIPIEIKPRTEKTMQVDWQLSTDDWDKPNALLSAARVGKSPSQGVQVRS
jgi:hypothetical protein